MTDEPSSFTPTERTTLRRHPERADHERAAVEAILDEAYYCHLAYVVDGRPVAIPTVHARIGARLYVHGSAASRTLRALSDGLDVCVTVTLLDGLVVARSAFHHSLNYRSVVVYGRAEPVTDVEEKAAALDAVVDHVLPGRRGGLRPHHEKELRATTVLAIALTEASAKVRTGGPADEPDDLGAPVWAGQIPLSLVPGEPVPEPDLDPTLPAPTVRRP